MGQGELRSWGSLGSPDRNDFKLTTENSALPSSRRVNAQREIFGECSHKCGPQWALSLTEQQHPS